MDFIWTFPRLHPCTYMLVAGMLYVSLLFIQDLISSLRLGEVSIEMIYSQGQLTTSKMGLKHMNMQ